MVNGRTGSSILGLLVAVTAMAALGIRAGAQGTILWNESVNGELSRDGSHPTSLTPVSPGTNTVVGSTEITPYGGTWGVDPDFFTITIPSNLVVSAVYIAVSTSNVWSWIGDPAFLNQLGWIQNPTNGDILPQWGLSRIGSGTFGLDIENHDAQPVPSIADYRLDFVAQPTPEPASLGLLLLGSAVLARKRGPLTPTRQFRSRP